MGTCSYPIKIAPNPNTRGMCSKDTSRETVNNYLLSPSGDTGDVFNMIRNCFNVRLSIWSDIVRRKVDLLTGLGIST